MYETNTNMPIISHAELHSFFVWIRRTCFSKIQSRMISLLIQEQIKEILSAQLQKPLAICFFICGPKICFLLHYVWQGTTASMYDYILYFDFSTLFIEYKFKREYQLSLNINNLISSWYNTARLGLFNNDLLTTIHYTELFLLQTSFFTEIREIVRHEDLPIFDHLIYKRGTLLDKLLRRGSDVDYLCHNQSQNVSRGINHAVINNDRKYTSPGNYCNTFLTELDLPQYLYYIIRIFLIDISSVLITRWSEWILFISLIGKWTHPTFLWWTEHNVEC